MMLATISRVTGGGQRHLGDSFRSLEYFVVYVDQMTYTVLAASISNVFLGRLFLHIDTMSSDESTMLCGRVFNTTEKTVTPSNRRRESEMQRGAPSDEDQNSLCEVQESFCTWRISS